MYALFYAFISGYGSAEIIEIEQDLTLLQSQIQTATFLWLTVYIYSRTYRFKYLSYSIQPH